MGEAVLGAVGPGRGPGILFQASETQVRRWSPKFGDNTHHHPAVRSGELEKEAKEENTTEVFPPPVLGTAEGLYH